MAYSIKVEAALGADWSAAPASWVWTDITRWTKGKASIQRGRPDRATGQPTQMRVRLDNTDKRFSPRHPQSVWCGQWQKGTPVRVSINPGTGAVLRAQGAVSAIAGDWPAGNSSSAFVDVTVSGRLRQLQQGRVLQSAPVRYIPTTLPAAYWPLEDGELAELGAPLVGAYPMAPFVGSHPSGAVATYPTFGSGQLGPWLMPVMARNGNSGLTVMAGRVVMDPASTAWAVDLMYASGTGADTTALDINPSYLGGAAGWPQLTLTPGVGHIDVSFNGEPEVTSTLLGLYDGRGHHVRLEATQSGAKVAWTVYVDAVSANTGVTSGNMTLPPISSVALATVENSSPVAQGHLAVWGGSYPAVTAAWTAAMGWSGELASARVARLAAEESISCTVTGTSTTAMGAQRPATVLDLWRECETADQGILSDGLHSGIGYLAGASRYNASVALALSTARGDVKFGSAAAFRPVEDDSTTRNKISASRAAGESATWEDDRADSPLSTRWVGVYDDQVTVNVPAQQLVNQAGWRVHLGTVPEMRIPAATILPSHSTWLIAAWLACDLGARYTADTTLTQYPDSIDQVLDYYVEEFDVVEWRVQLTGSPAVAWQAFVVEDTTLGRAGFDGQNLAVAVSTTDTSWSVASPILPLMTTSTQFPADFPYDVECEGEVVRITATTSAFADGFGRTVSSNWGTADIGGAWTTVGGSAADYSVGAGVGAMALNSVNVSRKTTIGATVVDPSQVVTISTSALATGAAQRVGLMARYIDASNYYRAVLSLNTDQTIDLRIIKRVAAAETTLTTVATSLIHAAGTTYSLRFSVVGTTLRARAWPGTAVTEPGTWAATATDSDLTAAAAVGCHALLVTGNTNALPVTASFDGYAVESPQTVTVTRSINGATRAHAAGALLTLHEPGVIAL